MGTNDFLKDLLEGENHETELVPGLTAEEMSAVFFDADALKEAPYKLYQLNGEGHRYYYRFENGEPVFYPSVTTLLRQTMPTSPFLIQWMMQNGEQADFKRDLAASYGTLMHREIERLLIARAYDLDAVTDVVREWLEQENIADKYLSEWSGKLRKDILAFAQFAQEWKVRPLAIEISLCSSLGYAGCIDLPCILTDKKGNEFRAIVDFKSGRNGFWEEHELQLELYRLAWNETYPELPVERIFNWSPKDWRKSPTYNFKEQTDSANIAKVPALLELAKIEDEKRENNVTFCEGVINLDGDLAGNYKTLSLAELITARTEEKADDTPATNDGQETGELFADEAAEPVKKTRKRTPKAQEVK